MDTIDPVCFIARGQARSGLEGGLRRALIELRGLDVDRAREEVERLSASSVEEVYGWEIKPLFD